MPVWNLHMAHLHQPTVFRNGVLVWWLGTNEVIIVHPPRLNTAEFVRLETGWHSCVFLVLAVWWFLRTSPTRPLPNAALSTWTSRKVPKEPCFLYTASLLQVLRAHTHTHTLCFFKNDRYFLNTWFALKINIYILKCPEKMYD